MGWRTEGLVEGVGRRGRGDGGRVRSRIGCRPSGGLLAFVGCRAATFLARRCPLRPRRHTVRYVREGGLGWCSFVVGRGCVRMFVSDDRGLGLSAVYVVRVRVC